MYVNLHSDNNMANRGTCTANEKSSRRRLSFPQMRDDTTVLVTTTCELCHKSCLNLSAPEKWKSEAAHRLAVSLGLSLKSLVCLACRNDVCRSLSNKDYVPRWKKCTNKTQSGKCCVHQCHENTFSSLKKPAEEISSAFQKAQLHITEFLVPVPTPLCKHHYHMVYNPTQTHCVTCGMSLKHANPEACPNSMKVEECLRENTSFDGNIKDGDKVCYACCRSHLVILHELSSISDLELLISNISKQSPTTPPRSVEEAVDRAMISTTITVGEELRKRNVLLLPEIHELFCTSVNKLYTEHGITPTGNMPSSRWVVSNLITSLKCHISCKCKTRKFGTLIHRPGTDLVSTLAKVSWRRRNERTPTECCMDNQQQHKPNNSFTETMDGLNSRIHSQIRSFLCKAADSPFDHANVNIDKIISEIDP